jgi:hypothetical protein
MRSENNGQHKNGQSHWWRKNLADIICDVSDVSEQNDLIMAEVCNTFGQFVKFYVGQSDNDSTAATSCAESE